MLTMDNILNADGTVKSKNEFENFVVWLLALRKYSKNLPFEKKTENF